MSAFVEWLTLKSRKVVGFVGMPGAGKSTAVAVAKEFGPVVTMGDVIREELKRRGLENTPENSGAIARELRAVHGPTVVAVRCVEKIRRMDDPVVIVDGLRSLAEVREFRRAFDQFLVVAVLADERRRHEWMLQRGREDDPVRPEDLLERDRREREFGIEEVLASANYSINNDGDVAELEFRTRALLRKIVG
ncbi:MAG: hypothetical protein Kow0069_22710 [Promethearchaeota archaeon]